MESQSVLRGIKDLAVFPSRLFECVLWCDEAVRHESPKPVRDMKEVVVTLFFVHGGQHLNEFCVNGGMVALAPIEERVSRVVVALKWFGHPNVMTLK